MHWEKQTEAVRNLLGDGTRRIISLDEMRRGFENFGAEKYKSLSFYRRRLEAMIDILIEKEVISEVALKSAIEHKRKIWEGTSKEETLMQGSTSEIETWGYGEGFTPRQIWSCKNSILSEVSMVRFALLSYLTRDLAIGSRMAQLRIYIELSLATQSYGPMIVNHWVIP